MWGWDQVMASASIYQNFDLNRTKYPTFIYKYVCMYLMCLCSETNIWFLPCHSRARTHKHKHTDTIEIKARTRTTKTQTDRNKKRMNEHKNKRKGWERCEKWKRSVCPREFFLIISFFFFQNRSMNLFHAHRHS